ncbi:hypothetical protein OHR68_20785 [Spirillospora sp. NBC_00431]
MLYAVIEWTCMIGALAALTYKSRMLFRADRDPALVAICVYFFFSALSFFLGLEPIWPHLAGAFGYENITTIFVHCSVLVLTAAQLAALLFWSNPPEVARVKVRRLVLASILLLILLIALFVNALPSERRTAQTVSLLNMDNPKYVVYLYFYLILVAAGQAITVGQSLKFAAIAGHAWLRRGMRFVTVGAILILVYCAMRCVEIIGVRRGIDMEPWDPVQWLAGDTGSFLELIGWTIPAWGMRLSATKRWTSNLLAYHRLWPLWLALFTATPTIAQDSPGSRISDLVRLGGLERRLYRRVIEILDGQLALRQFYHPIDAKLAMQRAQGAHVQDQSVRLAADAFKLHAAIHAKEMDRPASGEGRMPSPVQDEGGDLSGQIEWLVRLAHAFARVEPVESAAVGQPEGVTDGASGNGRAG